MLQGQSEQLSDVTTRLHKALTKLELCQGQLEKKQREVKELQEAAKVGTAAGDPMVSHSCWHARPSPSCAVQLSLQTHSLLILNMLSLCWALLLGVLTVATMQRGSCGYDVTVLSCRPLICMRHHRVLLPPGV